MLASSRAGGVLQIRAGLSPAMEEFASEDDWFSMEDDIAADTYTNGSWVASEEDCLCMESDIPAAYNVTHKY
jgi:hypothetical protein